MTLRTTSLLAVSMLLVATGHAVTRAATVTPVADVIFVSDDDARPRRGCDALSVVDATTGRTVSVGDEYVSPGRIAGTSDASLVLAVSTNSTLSRGEGSWPPFIYSMRRSSAESMQWRSSAFSMARAVHGGSIAVYPNDQHLVLASPAGLDKYDVANVTSSSLGPTVARATGLRVGDIAVAGDSSVVFAATVDGKVFSLDADNLTELAPPIGFEPVSGQAQRLRNTNITLAGDGRFLVINAGNRPEITVVDLVAGTSVALPLESQRESWGVAFDLSGANNGLLAVHGRSRVAVYEFRGTEQLRQVALADVPPQSFSNWDVGPENPISAKELPRVAALAWTGRGDGVVATIGTAKEFRILDFHASGPPSLTRRLDFDGCTASPGWGVGFDILTFNGRIHTPTATPTATSPATPSATPPPTMTRSATPTDSPTYRSNITSIPLRRMRSLRSCLAAASTGAAWWTRPWTRQA